MRGTVLRIGKQEDGATIQGFQSLFGRSTNEKGRIRKQGELPEVCSHTTLKCLYLARIGRPDILWSAIKFARSVFQWTQACDRRLARLISNIHHTNDYRQYCHVGNTAQHCRLCFFQDSDFAGDLEESKSISRAILCIFGSRTFVSICRMCKKHTSASHSTTESEIISLDAGLRMDEFLGLWDMVSEVLSSTNSTKTSTNPASDRCEIRTLSRNTHNSKQKGKRDVEQLSHVDYVPTNTNSSQGESQLYIF